MNMVPEMEELTANFNFKSIIPEWKVNSYFIVAPSYNRKSAGVRALHLLCHWLNRAGYPAFIHILGSRSEDPFHPDLVTPEMTETVARERFKDGRAPIVVYPEIIAGNPLGATCVVRYVLNYPGLLGGDKTYDATEMIFAYTDRLAQSVVDAQGVLFMPLVDRSIFHPGEVRERHGACFYAAKYRSVGHQVFGLPAGAVEIHNYDSRAQTPSEIAELFRTCEKFYTFEDTALALEAALCGCPTVAMRSSFFSEPLGLTEFAGAGFALDDTPEEFARARASVGEVAPKYDEHVANFWHQLNAFIAATQAKASATPPMERPIALSMERPIELSMERPIELSRREKLLRRLKNRLFPRT